MKTFGLGLIVGALVVAIFAMLVFSFPPKEEVEIVEQGFDMNYFDNRFERLEIGVLSASQDKCSVLGGVFPVDANRMPLVYEFEYLVDANTNTFQRIPMWPCLFFPNS